MRARLLSLLALVTLALSACMGDSAHSLASVELASVTPDAVTADASIITITGANFFQSTTAGSMRVEACGVTTTANIVEPLTQTVLLPPAGKLVVEAGDRLTAELPSEGFEPGVSDVRVTRPDGSSAVLEAAITCGAATEPDDGTEDPGDDDTEDPGDEEPGDPDDEEPADPTPGRLSVTLSPDFPLTITISGPEGYSQTVTGAATLTDLEPGEYTLSVDDATLPFEQEHEGTIYAYQAWWGPSDGPTVIEVEAGKEAEAKIALLTTPGTITLAAPGAPDSYDPEDIFLDFERLQDDGSWAPADLRDFPQVEPGIYRAKSEAELTNTGCVSATCYSETYHLVDDGGIVAVSSLGAGTPAEFSVTYELEPGTIKVESTGLPEDLTHAYVVQLRYEDFPYMGPPLENATVADPGAYHLSMRDVGTTIDGEHPDMGYLPIFVYYKASSVSFALNSGDEYLHHATYALADGLLRVNITGYQGDPDAIGHVRFRKLGDSEWTTVTTQGMKYFDVEPGIWEVETFDVPAEPGVHNGYYRSGSRPDGYLLVDSYGYEGTGNHVTIDIEYRAN